MALFKKLRNSKLARDNPLPQIMDVAAAGEDETMTTLVTTTLMTSPAWQDCDDDVNIVEQNNDFAEFKQSISTNILPGIFISLISLR